MATQQRTQQQTKSEAKPSVNTTTPSQEAAAKPLSTILVERNILPEHWRTMDTLFPGAATNSKLLVFDYCRARKLDPMKKPCHIVPMRVKIGKDANGKAIYEWRDTIFPGIYELRTTAHRTGLYMGHSEPEYGPPIDVIGCHGHKIQAPQWIRMVFYKWHPLSSTRTEFPVKVQFIEVAAFKDWEGEPLPDGITQVLNEKWSNGQIQMGTKCCEAAGLRETFPDDIGGEHTVDEMQGRTIDASEFNEVVERVRGKPKAAEPEPTRTEATTWSEVPVDLISKKIDNIGIPMSQFLAQFEVGSVKELPLKFVNAAMEYLDAIAAKMTPPSEGGSHGQHQP